MRVLTTAVVTALLFTTTAVASSLEKIAARSIDAYQQIEVIRSEMKAAASELTEQQRSYDQAVWVFDQPTPSATKLHELDSQIAREEQRLDSQLKNNASTTNTNRTKYYLNQLRMERKISRLSSADDRAAYRSELEAKSNALQAKISVIEKPYRDRIDSISATVDSQNKAFTEAMTPYFMQPTGAFSSATPDHLTFTMHMAFGGLEWLDADGKRIAWAHVRIRPKSEIEEYDRKQLLDGEYPIRSLSDDTIWVWAGNFLVTFIVTDEALKNKSVLQDAVSEFVDLEGLASVAVSETQGLTDATAPAWE